jgi:hypothetical protein
MLTPEQHAIERAICDRAEAYARRTMASHGLRCCSISAEEAKHPDYAACNNAMRGRVEFFELHRDKPEAVSLYVSGGGHHIGKPIITTWVGHRVDTKVTTGPWQRNNMGARWRLVRMTAAWGGEYSGREYDSRQLVNFRRLKGA